MTRKPTYEQLEQRIRELESVAFRGKDTEKELEALEIDFSNAQRLAHLGTWNWDIHTGEVTWSREVYTIFGLDPADFHPEINAIMGRFHPADRAMRNELMGQLLSNSAPYTFEARILLPDGRVRNLISTFEGSHDAEGNLVHVQGVVQDITDLKQAEQKLHDSERFLDDMIDQSPLAMWISDATGQLIRINPSCCRLLNIDEEEVVGRYNISRDRILEQQGVMPLVRSVFEEGKTVRFHIQYHSSQPDHSEIEKRAPLLLDVTIFPIKDASGKVLNAVIQNVDITKQKKAEAAMYRSKRDWETTFDAISDWVSLIDPDFHILRSNRAGTVFLERPMKDVLGNRCFELLHDTDEPIQDCPMRTVFTSKKREETEIQSPDGRWFRVSVDPIVDQNNDVTKAVHIVQDITTRKKIEEALRESEEKYRDLVENLNDVLFIIDKNGVLTFVNSSIKQMLNYSPTELIGKPFAYFTQKEDLPRLMKHFEIVLSGRLEPHEFRLISGSRELHWVRSSSRPIFKENTVVGIQGVLSDITESKNLQSQLQQARKMEAIGTLAGGIAHDFNNILGIILGNTELAMEDVPEWSPARLNLTEIRTASLRARDVIRQLLSFARKTESDKKPMNIAPIVKESLKLLRSSLPKNIEIRQSIEEETNIVLADSTQIHQVLINLCTNAGHAMPQGGFLDIILEKAELNEDNRFPYPGLDAGRYVKLTVGDSGHGISEEEMDRIFDPYFTTKEIEKGTGMGLAIVHSIVQHHNGTIIVQSELGKGTRFELLFPVVDMEAVSEVESDEELFMGNEKILFVDDERSIEI